MAANAETTEPARVVVRISPTAHVISLILLVGLLVFVPPVGGWALGLLALPVLFSLAVERLRTTADATSVTARRLFSERTLAWTEIEGLRFNRGGWARACLHDGVQVTLPAVTFATLPRLTAASGGVVPNPYRR